MKDLGKGRWLICGTLLVLAVCATLIMGRVPTPFTPMPLYQVLLAWTTGFGFLAVLPAVYFVTFAFLWDSKRFGEIVLVVASLIAILSVLWFVNAWDYGERYQGPRNTLLVAIENIIGFAVVITAAVVGIRRRSKHVQAGAYLVLFALLSWCAFPYLGELP